jgi:hypothetical protein
MEAPEVAEESGWFEKYAQDSWIGLAIRFYVQ